MHPSLRILLLTLLALAVQLMEGQWLAVAGGMLIAIAVHKRVTLLLRILNRSRWLMLTLVAVYAFTTPGEYLRGWDAYAPTYEGIHQGVLQMARLAIMLMGLALLLGTTRRPELMAGIYQLMRPLQLFGISTDRFTARLWLTMHYVESEQPERDLSFWKRFEVAAEAAKPADISAVQLSLPRFTRRDWMVLSLIVFLAAWLLA